MSARVADEQMRTDDGKALTYQETVERMATTPTDDWYTSPVPAFVDVINFKFEDRFAEVLYEMDGAETEEQIEQMDIFYESLILTAEPFSIDTLQITNETTGETKEVDLR